jgi:hypothetical protein
MNKIDRISIASRVFFVCAILATGLITNDQSLIQTSVVLAALASTASAAGLVPRVSIHAIGIFEAVLAGLVIGSGLPFGAPALPYLLVPAFVAGTTGRHYWESIRPWNCSAR